MARASLSYFIKDKNIVLFSDALVNIDIYTTRFNSAKDMYNQSVYQEDLNAFNREYKSTGKFKVVYIDRGNVTRVLPVLYDGSEINVDDIVEQNIVSESEKTRRKLLNSKEQLFSKLFLLNKDIENAKCLSIEISYDEFKLLKNNGIYTYTNNSSYYVSIEDLIKYRASHKKLGKLRPIYEEALDIWKEKMDRLSYDDIYYLSREYHIIDKNYKKVREKGISINNLNIVKDNIKRINGNISVKSNTPYLMRYKMKKKKLAA